jgi:hypothetical protein
MMREGSAFLSADMNDLNNFRVGISATLPRCLTRLNRMRWLIFGGESVMGADFWYSRVGHSHSPVSAASFWEWISWVKRSPAISAMPESVDHDIDEDLGQDLCHHLIPLYQGQSQRPLQD